MATKLIEMEDGTLMEVEVSDDQAQPISGGMAEKVETSFERIAPVLKNICEPISEVWKDLSRDIQIDSAEVQLGLSFEGQGNIFVTKAKAGANLTVKLVLKPKPSGVK